MALQQGSMSGKMRRLSSPLVSPTSLISKLGRGRVYGLKLKAALGGMLGTDLDEARLREVVNLGSVSALYRHHRRLYIGSISDLHRVAGSRFGMQGLVLTGLGQPEYRLSAVPGLERIA